MTIEKEPGRERLWRVRPALLIPLSYRKKTKGETFLMENGAYTDRVQRDHAVQIVLNLRPQRSPTFLVLSETFLQ